MDELDVEMAGNEKNLILMLLLLPLPALTLLDDDLVKKPMVGSINYWLALQDCLTPTRMRLLCKLGQSVAVLGSFVYTL
jgi:hypothetical protein